MPNRETILDKSAHVLGEQARDVANLARTQRATADKQHETAHKLEKVSAALEIGVADLKGDLKRLRKRGPKA